MEEKYIMSEQDVLHNKTARKMMYGSLLMAIMVFFAMLFYSHLYYGVYSLESLATAVFGTADVMLGMSFAMSGLAYYFDFLDHRVAYRKYMGLTGYFLALLYSAMLVRLYPETYFYGFFDNLLTPDFIFGGLAMLIFTGMAIISNNTMMLKLGPHRWRSLLRLGYVGYFFFIVRAFFIEWDTWAMWFTAPQGVPPIRLIATIFACSVILLRISVSLSKFFKSHGHPALSDE